MCYRMLFLIAHMAHVTTCKRSRGCDNLPLQILNCGMEVSEMKTSTETSIGVMSIQSKRDVYLAEQIVQDWEPGLWGKSHSAPFPLIWRRSLANAHNTIISTELRLSTSIYPINGCKKLSDLLRTLRVRPHHTLNAIVMPADVIHVASPLAHGFSPTPKFWAQAWVISDVTRTFMLASESDLDMAKLRTNSVRNIHVSYTFLPYKCKGCLSFVYIPDKFNVV
jgi:hypothetical protein